MAAVDCLGELDGLLCVRPPASVSKAQGPHGPDKPFT